MSAVGEFLSKYEIGTVEMSVADLTGALRGKRLPVRAFRSAGVGGECGLSSALFAWDYQADVFPGERYNWSNGYPDVFLRPDLDTLRVVAWRPGTAFVTCDVVDGGGRAVGVSGKINTNYYNADLDGMNDEAKQSMDRKRRLELFHRINRIVVDDAAAMPLYQQIDLYGVNRRLVWKARGDERIKGYDMAIR